jgi:hypothetical protein
MRNFHAIPEPLLPPSSQTYTRLHDVCRKEKDDEELEQNQQRKPGMREKEGG